MISPRLFAGITLASALLCSGCSMQPAAVTSPSGTASGSLLRGSVHGGQQPVAGGRVYLMQANTAGYGAPSISLLTQGDGQDSLGNYVLTDASGSFALSGKYTCTPDAQAYILVLGGVPIFGGQDNAALSMVGALGNCPAGGDFSAAVPIVSINELTTVAAMYAASAFATDVLHISSSGTPLARAGIANAFANAASLVDISTGAALAAPPTHNGVVPQAKINTLGDLIAPCINSDGSGPGCSILFANALGDSGVPTDTASAVLNIAHHPTDNISTLAGLVMPTSPFQPTLATAPADWSLSVVHLTNSAPSAVAPVVDAAGTFWYNDSFGKLTHLSATGDVLSQSTVPGGPANTLTASSASGIFLTAPLGFTTDGWNEVQPALPMNTGPAIWQGMESAAAFDSLGQLWVALSGFDGIGQYPAPSASMQSNTFLVPGLLQCGTENAIAVDSGNNVWVSCNAQNTIVKTDIAGSPLSGSMGFVGVSDPQAIALDAQDRLWVANNAATVSALDATGAPLSGSPFAVPENGHDVAVDGLGYVWVLGSNGVYRLDSTGSLLNGNGLQSAVNGFAHAALDGAGNLWATSPSSGSVVQFIGVAAPVITPSIAGTHAQLP